MRGYNDASYGDAFADVYDDWYRDISDVSATVATLTRLAGDGPVLELGVGTGRIAVPLAASGIEVHGIDTSAAMLDRLRAKDPSRSVILHTGDMIDALPTGPFALVFIAYNTLFNVLTAERQRACFAAVAERLTAGGAFVVEAFVPDEPPPSGSEVTLRDLAVDKVVLSVTVHRPDEQRADGQYVELTEAGGVRLRPWAIRWAYPAELDEMAAAAGLTLADRWETFDGERFSGDSQRHVSVYRKHC